MKYFFNKIAILILTLFLVSVVTFFAFHIVPGDPALMILGTEASEEKLEALREELGTNKPVFEQYSDWISGLFRGDLGTSIKYKEPVVEMILSRAPVTVLLTIMVMSITLLLGIPLGVYAAHKKNSWLNPVFNFFTMIGISIPGFFLSVIIIWIFGLILKWFVPGGYISYEDDFIEFLHFMIFPAISIALPETAILIKYIRAAVITEQDAEYVRTARSKGNKESAVLFRHILKNAIVSIVPLVGMMIGSILGGSLIIEQVYGIPGIGRLLISAVTSRDFPLVQALVLYIAAVIVVINYLVDIIIQLIDPRIRIQKGKE
ncbi:MAG: ABC transporter permease [Roseburia sp.]